MYIFEDEKSWKTFQNNCPDLVFKSRFVAVRIGEDEFLIVRNKMGSAGATVGSLHLMSYIAHSLSTAISIPFPKKEEEPVAETEQKKTEGEPEKPVESIEELLTVLPKAIIEGALDWLLKPRVK